MQVLELWRYPVKSLGGERVDEITVTTDGLTGDRGFAIFDVDTGYGLTARRVPEMLFAAARLRDDGTAAITLPDGSDARTDDDLSRWLGRRVALRSVDEVALRRYENPIDFEHETTSDWLPFTGAGKGGPFHDSSRTRVSLVSTGSIGTWDRRRFRANVLLDGEGEDGLVGSDVEIGDTVLSVGKRLARCVVTTRPQPGGVERDLDVLKTINRERDGCIAIGALVTRPGTVRVGDGISVRESAG
ncbi:MAG TPA: MOSC N-terminal beta barrel domain-containing protein [Acidimicrobiia bacterium]|nr:MOSC N-terminal beta barrel domain-containing protein [Acidimicrobiia bacterium]